MKQLISLVGGLVLFGSANAAVISYDFTATIDSIRESAFLEYPGTSVTSSQKAGPSYSIGDIVQGHFEYDTQTGLSSYQPAPQPDVNYVLYQNSGAKNMLSATTSNGATLPAVSAFPLLQVMDTAAGGDFFNISRSDFLDNAIQTSSVMLGEYSGSWLNSSAIPQSLLGYAYASFSTNYFFFSDYSSLNVSATITSLTPASAVPEPSSYLMLLAGLLVVAYCRHHRAA